MRCPACGSFDDKVVDSRQADDGTAIRRRRACIDCGRRFTTFERLEELALVVVKRSGEREPFEREKVAAGIRLAAKGRPIEADGGGGLDELITAIEDAVRIEGGAEVSSEAVGRVVLEQLREADPVAAIRFASVYLGFDDLADFEREVTLLAKRTAPKRHEP
jgi:transcriptional repressor NrdR